MVLVSRQHWTTALAVFVLVMYIAVDIVSKVLDGNITSDEAVAAPSHSKQTGAGLHVATRIGEGMSASQEATMASLVKHQESQIQTLSEELRKARAMLDVQQSKIKLISSTHEAGKQGATYPGENAVSMTLRFLDPEFQHQASLPGETCIAGIGIPAADTAKSRARRIGQRDTWHKYDGVKQQKIVVRYLLAKHPTNDYKYTEAAIAEARDNHDVYGLKMREGVPTQRNEGMKSGYWGFTAALGISRKGLIWYRMGAYYNCSYILKGDDDMYWNVPQYLHDLAQLPKQRMMWGKGMHYGCRKKSEHCVYFVVGMVLTMSRDVAMAITHVPEFLPWADAVENDDREESLMTIRSELQAWTFDHEDVLVGRLLRESGINATVYDDFRFHDCGVGFLIKPVNKWSVVMHRCKQEEWPSYRERFREDNVIDWKLILQPWLWKQEHRVSVIDRGTFVGFERRLRYQFLERVRPPGEPAWD